MSFLGHVVRILWIAEVESLFHKRTFSVTAETEWNIPTKIQQFYVKFSETYVLLQNTLALCNSTLIRMISKKQTKKESNFFQLSKSETWK